MGKWINLTGQKIGKLFIIDGNLTDRKKVLVQCDCGSEFSANKSNILQGRTKSCGKGICHPEFVNLVGQKFYFLTPIKMIGKHPKRNIFIWECLCECGEIIISYADRLKNGNTKSCGCKTKELISIGLTKPDNHSNSVQVWYSYIDHAIAKNRVFEIPFDVFQKLLYQECHYCGSLPPKDKNNGIDRVDNNIGYVLSNCVTACKNCNLAKRALSYSDFINLAKKITEHHSNDI